MLCKLESLRVMARCGKSCKCHHRRREVEQNEPLELKNQQAAERGDRGAGLRQVCCLDVVFGWSKEQVRVD